MSSSKKRMPLYFATSVAPCPAFWFEITSSWASSMQVFAPWWCGFRLIWITTKFRQKPVNLDYDEILPTQERSTGRAIASPKIYLQPIT